MYVECKKTIGKEEKIGGANISFGENLDEVIANYGEKETYNIVVGALAAKVRLVIGRCMEAGKSPEEIQDVVDAWKPGKRLVIGVDPMVAMKKKIASMDPAQVAELLAELSGAAGEE